MTELLRQLELATSLKELLRQRSPLPYAMGVHVLSQIAQEVRRIHERGWTHRAIQADQVGLRQGQPQLGPAPESRLFGGVSSDPDYCPPELMVERAVEVPRSIAAAEELFRSNGIACDPRRIDLYQLGALAVRLFCTASVQEYLCSPRARARLPAELYALVDGALGYCAADRLNTIEHVLEHLPAGEDAPRVAGDGEAGEDSRTLEEGQAAGVGERPPFAQLGSYRITGRIGRGGMGDVYRGYDESLQRAVAIKVLLPALARDEAFVRRFAAEATAMAQINHPAIVPVYGIGEEGEYHYFAMQYVAGESLGQRLTRQGRLEVDEVVDLLRQCLEGLEVAHGQGLIHRDIKPENILLDQQSGRAMLVDFGLVRRMNSGQQFTSAGLIMGTVDYMAPEQALGRTVDARTDLYALGVLAYQMLSGAMPYRGDTPTSVIYQHAHEEPVPLVEVAPGLPGPLYQVVARMMARRPEDRYPSCAEVLSDLQALREGGPLAPVAVGPTDPEVRSGPAALTSSKAPRRAVPIPWRLVAVGILVAAVVWVLAALVPFRPPAVATPGFQGAVPAGTWVDLLNDVKLKVDVEQGSWRRDRDGLHAEWGQASRLLLPVRIAGDYSFEVEFTIHAGNGSVVLILPVGSRNCLLILHGWEGLDGLEMIDGRRVNNNPTTRPSGIEREQRHVVRVDVRATKEEARIVVFLDGQSHVKWHGLLSSLSTCAPWLVSDESRPALGISDVDATFRAARWSKSSSP